MENKNYYDWLEVSPKASQEVIEKAYKALAMKYHPDLQQNNNQQAEELMKNINEAYNVLSDAEKRAQYDAELEAKKKYKQAQENSKKNSANNNNNNNNNTKNNDAVTSNINNSNCNNDETVAQTATNSNVQASNKQIHKPSIRELAHLREIEKEMKIQSELAELEYQKQIEIAKQKAYYDAYIQDLRNRGYKIRYKKSFKDYIRIAIAICIFASIIAIAWQIPFVRNYFIKFCNDNKIIQAFLRFLD